MAFDPDQRIVRSAEALATEVGGELVLMSIVDGRYYGLDPVGSEIWRQLESATTTAVLCREIQSRFHGDAERIERETLAFVDTLAENGLVGPV